MADLDADLRESLGTLLFQEVPCLVAVVDHQGLIVAANASFGRTFGHREGEPCFAVYKGRTERCERCVLEEAIRAGVRQISEEEGLNRHGQAIQYHMEVVPLEGDHLLQMAVDVTALRRAERDLRQAERLAMVGLTTAGLAHSIKNLMAGLEGGAYVVNSGLSKDNLSRVRGGWEMVQRGVDQIAVLVRNLLRLSKSQELHREEVDVGDLLTGVVGLFTAKAELMDIQLSSLVQPGLSPLWLDPEEIKACLTNLIANALDACSLDPDDSKDHAIMVQARSRPGGGVILEVEDNGMGIAEEHRTKVLEAHFTTKGIRGTGLGLLLTRKAIQEHGGEISFESSLGQGSTFRVELPEREGSTGAESML